VLLESGGRRQHGSVVASAEADRVAGQGCQIGKQGAEAMDRGPSAVRLLAALRCAAGEIVALARASGALRAKIG
jgi:hypothetical protein